MSVEMSNMFQFFLKVFSELAILFIIISFVVSVINQKLPAEKIKSVLSGNRGYWVAVGLGAITPFCSCSTLPMTIGLLQARAAFGPVMTFLFTSPLLNPFIVGLFWVSFGAPITLIYTIFVITLAVFSGFLLEKLNFQRFVRQDIYTPQCNSQPTAEPGKNKLSANVQLKWSVLFRNTRKQFFSFVPYMIIGIMFGAVIHGYVPQSAFQSLSSIPVGLLIPTAAIIGVFLYVRASTMVPIAASLAAKGMSMGAIMALTIGGAGASLPEMIMMKRMFHWPLVLAFIFLVFSTACITGFVIHWV